MCDGCQCANALYRPWAFWRGDRWCEFIDDDGRLGHCHTSRAFVCHRIFHSTNFAKEFSPNFQTYVYVGGRYQGILGSCIGLGNTIGPFVSAAFTQSSKTSWRGFFFLISPLMLCSGVASFFLLPSTMPKGQGLEKAKLIDWWGLATGSVAIICLLIPLSGGGSYFAWNSTLVIAMLAVGGAAAIAFVLVEWKVSKLPMVPSKCEATLRAFVEADSL